MECDGGDTPSPEVHHSSLISEIRHFGLSVMTMYSDRKTHGWRKERKILPRRRYSLLPEVYLAFLRRKGRNPFFSLSS
jgi:hypothetical protein